MGIIGQLRMLVRSFLVINYLSFLMRLIFTIEWMHVYSQRLEIRQGVKAMSNRSLYK